MEKVKLTHEQAKAIETAITEFGKDRVIDGVLGKWLGELSSLNDLKPSEFARIMYGAGYEVEPEFKVGDWVMHEIGELLGEVTRIYEDELEATRLGDGYIWNEKYVRHATQEEIAEEKQRRWWRKHGRDVYEFKAGDLIKCEDTTSEVESPEEDLIWIKMNGAKGTLPEKLYQGIEVICFAEDRKDIEGEQ